MKIKDRNSFLCFDDPILPNNLIKKAKLNKRINLLVVRASSYIAVKSSYDAFSSGLAYPILIGEPDKILKESKKLSWKLKEDQIISSNGEIDAATKAVDYINENKNIENKKLHAVMKGQLHTDIFMSSLLKKSSGIRKEKRLVHIFAIFPQNQNQEPLLISDAAVNVFPDEKTQKQSIQEMILLSKKIGHLKTKMAIISATETPISSIPSSMKAKELEIWTQENFGIEVSGPLSFDLAISEKAKEIKGILKNNVAGNANCLLVPDIVSGNILYKCLVYLSGGCAAGVVLGGDIPILLTSRADPPQARLASIALASIAC